jgi:hypothetical protein
MQLTALLLQVTQQTLFVFQHLPLSITPPEYVVNAIQSRHSLEKKCKAVVELHVLAYKILTHSVSGTVKVHGCRLTYSQEMS